MQSLISCRVPFRRAPIASVRLTLSWLLLTAVTTVQIAHAATPEEELLRQRERDRVLRDQLEARPDVRLEALPQEEGPATLPREETP